MRRLFSATLYVIFTAWSGWASGIQGTIIVKHKLTHRHVTVSTSAYERGLVVPLREDGAKSDPLEYERAHVVIFIEDQLPSIPATATMAQENRRFIPDLVVVPAGSTVSFPNQDPIFHNVFSLSRTKTFDLGNYPRSQTRIVMFPIPGIVLVNCHLHANMTGTILITPNQYYAVSSAEGRFALPNVPPGRHTLVAWHKAAGFFRQTVVVDAAHPANVEFFIPLDESGVERVTASRR